MFVALLERRVVLELDPLASRADVRAGSGLCTPEAHVAVVAAGENVAGVGCEGDREDALHALGVVDVSVVEARLERGGNWEREEGRRTLSGLRAPCIS